MKKKLKLIIALTVSVVSLGFLGCYQYPYWYGHRQLDKINLSDFKSKEAIALAKDFTNDFKLVFDEIYKNGAFDPSSEERKQRLIKRGVKVVLTPVEDLYKKYHIINKKDSAFIERHVFRCIGTNAEALHRLDPKRFPY